MGREIAGVEPTSRQEWCRDIGDAMICRYGFREVSFLKHRVEKIGRGDASGR